MITKEIAEFYGALLGDGCLTTYVSRCKNRVRTVWCVKLTGHTHDRQYYEDVLIPAIRKQFGINGYLQNRPKYNATTYDVISKNVFDFFHELGMPIGKKKDLNIPSEIIKDKDLAKACLRGLFNTDGSIYRRYSKQYAGHSRIYNHLVVQFHMNAGGLLKQVKEILEIEEIRTNKIYSKDNSYVLRITHQPSIHKFMKFINTRHKYHTERYLNNHQEETHSGLIAQSG